MPFASQAQAKWAFATKQPWARKWGHKTRLQGGIDKLPQYVARKNRKWGKQRVVTRKEVPSSTSGIGNASGPGGLFSASGLEKKNTSAIVRRSSRIRAPRPEISYKEGEGHTGAMVALYLSPEASFPVGDAARRMFGDVAEDPCDLHITLAYLGKVTDEGFEDRIPEIVAAIQRYVQLWLEMVGMPMIATLRGYDAFPHIENGKIPIYRVVDSPLLVQWVNGLKLVLDSVGVTTHRDFEPYVPHVTVAYSYPELANLVKMAPATPTPVQFDKVMIAVGEVHIDLLMANSTYKADVPETKKPQSSSDPKGTSSNGNSSGGSLPAGVTRIRGNLCQVHGKFGPCDGASSEGFNKKPKGGKGKGGGKAKPSEEEKLAKRKADIEQRKVEAEAQRVQNRTNALGALASRPNDQAMQVLDTLRAGGQPDGAMLQSMEATGLITKHSDGSYTLSSQGHGLLDALNKGDAGRAAEAIAGGKDQVAAASERATSRAQALEKRNAVQAERQQALQKRNEERQKRLVARGKKAPKSRKKREQIKPKKPTHQVGDDAQPKPTTNASPKPVLAPPTLRKPERLPTATPSAPAKDRRTSGGSSRPGTPGKRQ